MIDLFQLGLSNNSWDDLTNLFTKKKILDNAIEAGLVIRSENKSDKECPASAISAEDCVMYPTNPFPIASNRLAIKPRMVILFGSEDCLESSSMFRIDPSVFE